VKVKVVKNLPDHHGLYALDLDLVGKELDVDFFGRSECGGLLFEVLEQKKYWTPRFHGEWLGVCSHEIKALPEKELVERW